MTEKSQQIILNDHPIRLIIAQVSIAIIAGLVSEKPSISPTISTFAKEGLASAF